MSVLLLRYHVAENDVQAVVDAVTRAFAALPEESPDIVRFTYYQVVGAPEFVGVLELREGADNPLPKHASTRALKSIIDGVVLGGPSPAQPLKVLGLYEAP